MTEPKPKPLWLSFDVEATGPTPGLHSMVSVGIVAIDDPEVGCLAAPEDCVEVVIAPHPDFRWDADTERWWLHADRAEAYRATFDPARQVSATDAGRVLAEFLGELKARYPGRPHVWAAYPGSFDMPFVRYYMERFATRRWLKVYPMASAVMQRIACFDIGSLGMAVLGVDYHDVSSGRMVEAGWNLPVNPLPHTALNDAIEQGHILCELLRASRSQLQATPQLKRSLENVRRLATRMQKRGVADAEHLLRFCAEADITGSLLRG